MVVTVEFICFKICKDKKILHIPRERERERERERGRDTGVFTWFTIILISYYKYINYINTMLQYCIPATHTNHQYYNHRHTRDTSWTTDAVPGWSAGVPKGRDTLASAESLCGGEIKD